jgi:glucosamine--fructose-6-phosphate aminotransferase (isomerizing)
MDVRGDGWDAMADGGARAVNSEGFLVDILGEPEALERVVAAYGDRQLERMLDRPRLLLIGMGSSGYAAGTAVAALRSRGLDAHAELASTGTPQPAGADTLAMLISASGGSGETLEALRRHSGASRLLAITNTPSSELAAEADEALDVLAGPEPGGVACRSFACTQAVLALICGAPADDIRMAAAAVAQLIEGRERWLPGLVEVAEASRGVWVCGPAERFGSAQQSALMLREGPRIIADACETGDWLHVDVYLTKPAGYALLLLGGSRYDAEVAGWRRERDFRLVSVGRELAGADAAITFEGADRRVVAAIAETAVAELLAAELWRRSPI